MTRLQTLLLGAALAALPALASAQEMGNETISDISVSADFSAIDGANAMDFYPGVSDDLRAALGQTLQPFMGDDGNGLTVIVSELSLDGQGTLTEANANRLSGALIYATGEPGDTGADAGQNPPVTEQITVVAAADPSTVGGIAAAGPVYVVQPTEGDLYNALISGFAQVAAERMPGMLRSLPQ